MANVDNLNFEIILKDDNFEKKVKDDIQLAKDLNVSLSTLLDTKSKISKIPTVKVSKQDEMNVRRMAKMAEASDKAALAQQKLATESEKTAAAAAKAATAQEKLRVAQMQTERASKRAVAQTEKHNRVYEQQGRILQELKGYALGYLSIHGVSQLLSSLVRVTGEFELQKTTLAAMLGSLDKAESIITRIQGLAVESPFQFKELTTYAKQLSAFSVPAEELYETTKMLADISAGLGVGMDRIVLAYGQVRSAAFLRGQEVRQFTEAGIPILDELAKQFSELEGRVVSAGEVFDKISARLVPFEMVAKVFKDMTSEGGKFYQMQEIQAETLRGKISNLKDAYEVMLNEIGSSQSDKLKGAVDWVKSLMQNYEETGRKLVSLIASYGVYKATMIAVDVATKSFSQTNYKLIASLARVSKWIVTNPYAMLAAGVGTLAGVLLKASREQTVYEESLSRTKKIMADFNKEVNSERSNLTYLLDSLSACTVGTEEYEKAKNRLIKDYGAYLTQIDKEKIAVGELEGLYKKLTKSILDANREKALEAGTASIMEQYSTGYDDIFKKFDTTIKALKIEEKGTILALADYIRGDQLFENLPIVAQKAIEDVKQRINAAAYSASGQFGSGIQFAGFDFEVLKKDLGQLTDITTEFRKNLEWELEVYYGDDSSIKDKLEGWRKIVQDTLTGMGLDEGSSFGLWAKDTTLSTEYVDNMVKRYRELEDQISKISSFDESQAQKLRQNKEVIEAVAKALKIDIQNLAADKGDTKESKEEKRLRGLIGALRDLQDQYEKLKRLGSSDSDIQNLFKSLYPSLVSENGESFVTDLNYIERAIELVEQLKKLNPEVADRLLVDLGGDNFSVYLKKLEGQKKAYEESAKAAGQYYDTLQKWATEDFSLIGDSISLDVSKVASDLNQKYKEIDLRAKKAKTLLESIDVDSEQEVIAVKEIFDKEFGAGSWDVFYDEFLSKGENAIKSFTDKQKAYEKKLAQERVNDLAQKYVKESYFTEGIQLSELGDKNFFQLRTIRKKLQDLLDEEPLQIPMELQESLLMNGVDVGDLTDIDLSELFEDMESLDIPISEANQELLLLIQNIQKAGLSTVKFGEVIKKVIGGDFEELTKEESEALMSMVKDFMSEMNNLMSALSEYAEAIGNDKLQGAVNGLSDAMEILGSISDKLAKEDWPGAIISGVTSLATKVIEAITAQEKLNAAIEETRREMALLNSQKAIEDGVESIFGVDNLKKFQNAYEEVVAAHKQATEDMKRQNHKMFGGSKDDWGLGVVAGSAGVGAGLGAAIGSIFPGLGTAIGAGVGALVGMITGLVGHAATEANNYALTIQEMADSIGVDLIDSDTGMFDSESLKSIKETYSDLDQEYQQILDDLIVHAQIFENAVEEMAVYMTDIFGACADDMADSFIESFKKSGEAALEYESIMDDIATNIAKSIIKSTILQNVFDEEDAKQAAIELASGNTGGALAIIEDAMKAAQSLTPHIQGLLEELQPYFQVEDEGTSQDLGDGIKGVTEDTASLLASYINAIRADVSFAKQQRAQSNAILQQILGTISGMIVPSLVEYQQQIAANTYNTAMHTQAIMEDLQSVLTTEGGPAAIRTIS